MKAQASRKLISILICTAGISQPIQGTTAANVPQDFGPGVVVEAVPKGSEAARAGLCEGDIILRWTRSEEKGKIESPFDLMNIETAQAPRGAVTLEGLRDSKPRTWTLGEMDWKVTARPELPDALAVSYREGRELLKSEMRVEAARHWQAGVIEARALHSTVISIWLLFLTADMWSQSHQWEAADHSYQEALDTAEDGPPAIRIQLLHAWGLAAQQQGNWAKATEHYRQELKETQKLGAETLEEARALADLGPTANHDRQVQVAENLYRDALAIRRKLAPGSLSVAATLSALSASAADRGDMAIAEEYLREALAIKEKVVPDSLSLASTLNRLGEVRRLRGDLDGAEDFYRKALLIQEKQDPGGLQMAMSLNNWGIVESLRGNLSEGGDLLRQVLTIKQKLIPNSLSVAGTLLNLGSNAYARGLLDMAEDYYRQALAIYERMGPDSVGSVLYGLALVADDRGDRERAWKYYQDALAIQVKLAPFTMDAEHILQAVGELAFEQKKYQASNAYTLRALAICDKSAPQSVEMSEVLADLGALAQKRGFQKNARDYFAKALAVAEKVAPHSVAASSALHGLGSLAISRGDLNGAEGYYRRALVIEDKLAPGSLSRADSLHALGLIMRKTQRSGEALHFFEESVSALEDQIRHLGGAEDIHLAYRASYAAYYKDYIDFLMFQKQYDVAFQAAERWRARSLLNLLAEAHVDINKGVDARLINEERSLREKLRVKSNQLIQLLSEEHTDQEATAMHKEIADLLSKSKENEGLIRLSSPEYAALSQPQPLTVEQTKQLLDANTVLLEYLVGEAHSYLWLVTPEAVHAYLLPKRAELDPLVRELYELISTNNAAAGKRDQVLRAVSEMLLEPATDQLGAKRLLVVADGALQYLPFGILLSPATQSGGPQTATKGARRALVLDHEIVSLPSASILAVLRNEMEKAMPAAKTLAVFADPVFRSDDPRVHAESEKSDRGQLLSHADEASSSRRDLERSGPESGVLVFDRLPSTRKEANEILAFAKEDDALRALDFDASRATAMSQELNMFRIVHVASHALLNVQHPELSGVVLSLVDKQGQPQDGFLRLQDIYNLRLRADLVVLSACRTALGKEVQGEGLLGLTRGFMYAGTPRVVASLWKVPDNATAELMKEFYRGMLIDGLRPAAALRSAQVTISSEPSWGDPYYWAAFILQGEWR